MTQLDCIRVASPCPISWEQMTGDDRVRFCGECHLNVYNFAELTRTEAEELLRTAEGRICGRLYRRADGTVITKDCPVGLRAVRRRLAKVATAAFAALVSLCSAAIGQKQSDKDKACKQQVTITTKVGSVSADLARLTGTIVDPNGAVIARAKVTILDFKTNQKYSTTTNDEGTFARNLSPGTYDVLVESPGFKKLRVRAVKVGAGETKLIDAILLVTDGTVQLLGVIADSSLLDFSTSEIKTVFDSKMIERLPH